MTTAVEREYEEARAELARARQRLQAVRGVLDEDVARRIIAEKGGVESATAQLGSMFYRPMVRHRYRNEAYWHEQKGACHRIVRTGLYTPDPCLFRVHLSRLVERPTRENVVGLACTLSLREGETQRSVGTRFHRDAQWVAGRSDSWCRSVRARLSDAIEEDLVAIVEATEWLRKFETYAGKRLTNDGWVANA